MEKSFQEKLIFCNFFDLKGKKHELSTFLSVLMKILTIHPVECFLMLCVVCVCVAHRS